MRSLLKYLFVAVVCGALPVESPAHAAWGAGGCGPVGPTVVREQQAAPAFTGWRYYKGCGYYYRNGVQVAGYNYEENVYRTYDAVHESWGPPERPPWTIADDGRTTDTGRPSACKCGCSGDCPCDDCKCKEKGKCNPKCPCDKKPADTKGKGILIENLPTGVIWDKVRGGNRYTLTGRDATKAEAMEALEAGSSLSDDSTKPRITVIGSDADRALVDADWKANQLFTVLRDTCLYHSYPSGHWAISPGFVQAGHPTIYFESPDGKVLHRQDDYSDGATGLVAAVRKANPAYDASKDPDLRKTDSLPDNTWLWIGGGLGGLILLRAMGKGNN